MTQDAKTSAKGYDYASKIGSLIAMSEDESLSTEARAAYRLKAEQLMRAYRIAEEEAIAKDETVAGVGRFEIVLLHGDAFRSDLKHHYFEIWNEIARHAGIMTKLEYRYPSRDSVDSNQVVAIVYGYALDVRLAEFLWTAAHLVFVARIDAKPNPDLTDQENCYYLRNSGMPRNGIARALWGSDAKDGAAHGKVQRLYLAECAKRDEKPRVAGRGIQVGLYREAYADSFCDSFGWRLREARDAADSAGGGLVLHGRTERVQEAFWTAFPEYRPMTAEESAAERERLRLMREEDANCSDCSTSKSKSGMCRRHRPTEVTASDRQRWERRQYGPEAVAGRVNGDAAARSIDFARSAGPRTQRTESAPERAAIVG
jgi:hypothetical protein